MSESQTSAAATGRVPAGGAAQAERPASAHERELLRAAGAGDEHAFRLVLEPYHGELHAHCYRMLGSVHDAEDALQDALLRAWRALARFEQRSSLRSWLYRIATNTCLDVIARRPKRVLPIDYGPPADPHDGPGDPILESVLVDPYPDDGVGLADGLAGPDASYELRESVELAFVAALQQLPATQRAALILREVLGFSAQEVATMLSTSVAAVNSALQRARKAVDDRRPERSQQATLRALGDQRLRALVDGYMDAMARADVDAVVAMLTADANWSMPPLASWYRGPELPDFLRVGPLSGKWRWRHLPTRANGQAAVGCYTWHEQPGRYLPFALDVLTLEGDRIREVTAFIARTADGRDRDAFANFPATAPDPAKVELFFGRRGLPARID